VQVLQLDIMSLIRKLVMERADTKLDATSTRGSQGRAFDHKQALPGGNLYFSFSLLNFFPFLSKKRKRNIFTFQ
jgi:hypothetical protein